MKLPEIAIQLPEWVEGFLAERPLVFPNREDRMRLVIELARRNVGERTGGPFGAAVFDQHGGLIAPGINLVLSRNLSILHAEIVAMLMAQQKLGRYDLGGELGQSYELVTAAEPCAMCFGAVMWGGLRSMVCGARKEDVQASGFDEGAKVLDWVAALAARGITVYRDVLRQDASEVLREYVAAGGTIYNPRQANKRAG